jgi:class 3 adenylate cyclase
MEPRIQYAKTSDGVNIAYWAIGEGPPVLWLSSPPLSHIQMEWEWPLARRGYEKLAERRRLVRFDWRGSGLSDRHSTDLSLEANLLDIEAVIEKLKLDRVALLGVVDAGPAAITYAARHPERVSHLVLWGTYAQGGFENDNRVKGLFALMDTDWRMFSDTLAHTMFGWSNPEAASWLANFTAECTTADATKAAWNASFQANVMDLLPQVSAPTLVMHPARVPWVDKAQAQLLASRIPNARLQVIEDESGVLLFDEASINVTAIETFLSETEKSESRPVSIPSGTAVILFADIVDSTALTERLGDDAFREKARGLDEAMRAAIRHNGGTPVEGKTLGDGVLAVFTSAKQAIACAQACHEAASAAGLSLHAGIHAGDVIREADNVYGGAVNIAARVAAASAAGETLVSGTVRDLARTSAGVSFEDRGEQALKGIAEPVRVYAVRPA